jgi:hypothetical protein
MRLTEMLVGFVRGVVKVVISAVAGVGVGLVTMGNFAIQSGWDFQHEPPPGEIFFSVGAGLLTGAVLMAAQFSGPWACRNAVAAPAGSPGGPQPHYRAG